MGDYRYLLLLLTASTLFASFLCALLLFLNGRILQQQQHLAQAVRVEHRRALLAAALHAQEQERVRIGRDLHDDIGTALAQLKLTFSQALERQDLHTLAQSNILINAIIRDVRNVCHNLSPELLSLFTLSEAIGQLADNTCIAARIDATLQDADGILDLVPGPEAVQVYRIIEELLTNTVKHAGASALCIHLSRDAHAWHIVYSDNGCGLTPGAAARGRGLRNIQNRLTLLRGTSAGVAPGPGFRIHFRMPASTLNTR